MISPSVASDPIGKAVSEVTDQSLCIGIDHSVRMAVLVPTYANYLTRMTATQPSDSVGGPRVSDATDE